MPEPTRVRPADVHGAGRIVIDATLGITNLVEAVHSTILSLPWIFGRPVERPTPGITGFVYSSVRTITALVGTGIDLALMPLIGLLEAQRSSPTREAVIAALNGVVGDYLHASGNPLALAMCMRVNGQSLELSAPALAAAIPQASGKILLLVHGLCLTDQHWDHEGHNHGALLADELGYTPVYLHYNTGLHISTNGRALADMLAALISVWRYRSRNWRSWPIVWVGWWRVAPATTAPSPAMDGSAACARSFSSGRHTTDRPWSASATGSIRCLRLALTAPRLRAWAKSAVPASPTCATAACSTRTGWAGIASRARAIRAGRCRSPQTWPAIWSPPQPAASRTSCGTTVAATGLCRCRAPSASTPTRVWPCRRRQPSSGSATR